MRPPPTFRSALDQPRRWRATFRAAFENEKEQAVSTRRLRAENAGKAARTAVGRHAGMGRNRPRRGGLHAPVRLGSGSRNFQVNLS
jgi:uncharacterized protein YfiM (DUF2279 family)